MKHLVVPNLYPPKAQHSKAINIYPTIKTERNGLRSVSKDCMNETTVTNTKGTN